jgi:Flp pilus assembly protein TadD
MSLLLDALKSSEPNYPAEPEAEDQEDSLDARATLELLAARPAPPEVLSLAPTSEPEPSESVAAFSQAAAKPVADPLPPAAAYVRSGTAPSRDPPAPTANFRAAPATPAAAPTSKLSMLLMALVVLGGIGLAAKILWPKTYVVTNPDNAQPAPPTAEPAAAADPRSLRSVQVPSARPADHFAYTGNAPEIDLHETGAAAATVAGASAPTSAAPTPSAGAAPSESPAPHRRAAAAFTVTKTESESEIYRHVKAGYQALTAGDVAGAEREYRAALQLDPNSIDALLGSAAAAARDGKPAVAGETYAKVLKLEPGNPDATAAIAMLSRDTLANESAESHLKILIGGDDGSRPALHAALGGVYAADGRWSEAAQEYFAALGRDPGNPDLAFDVAASLDQNRNAVMALDFYRQALAFARQRPAQFDVQLVEERVNRLQAKAAAGHPDAAGAPEAR